MSPGGLNVCLTCFTGGCTGDLQHARRHFDISKHPIVLNIVKRKVEPADGAATKRIKADGTVATTIEDIKVADLEPKYEYDYSAYCYVCDQAVSVSADVNSKIAQSMAEIVAQQSATAITDTSFETEKPEHCPHAGGDSKLPGYIPYAQAERLPDLSNASLKKCTECDLTDNLWLCMICGALGCSRKGWDGTGGNGHAVAHNEATGHNLVLKVGTITPEGSADIWCYACNKLVIDDSLADHLAAFGINIAEQTRTSKSLAELELERNLNAQFNSVFDASGKPLKLLFGPGFTGFLNLGNSCYMSSVAQACFNTPAFIQRYWLEGMEHMNNCRSQRPGTCYLCQMAKVAHGLWSGRYSKLPSAADAAAYIASCAKKPGERNKVDGDSKGASDESASAVPTATIGSTANLQPGIAPRAFKKLIANQNSDFLGTEQQCAYEYFSHLTEQIHRQETALKERGNDVTRQFEFYTNTRIQCLECNRVKYNKVKTTSLSVPMPYVPAESVSEDVSQAQHEGKSDVATEATEAQGEGSMTDGKKKPKDFKVPPQPPVSFESCLDIWNRDEIIEGFRCSFCNAQTTAVSKTGFFTFPETLVIQMRRFGLFDPTSWVPSKLLTEVTFADPRHVDLEPYRLMGPNEGEEIMPESGGGARGAGGPVGQAPQEMIEQLTMITGMDPPLVNYALLQCDLNPDRAVDWLFSHPDFQIPDSEDINAGSTGNPNEPVPDINPAKFGMTAFVYHKGPSTMSGHYVAYLYRGDDVFEENKGCGPRTAMAIAGVDTSADEAKLPEGASELLGTCTDKEWVCYNDQKVSEAESDVIPIGQAYLYFLQRRS